MVCMSMVPPLPDSTLTFCNTMKLAFSLLMCLAAVPTMLPAQAATKVSTYEQAQSSLSDDGYVLFIYGEGWDKRARQLTTGLYNNPAIAKAAGKAAMMLVPLPESPDEAQKAALEKTMGKLKLPHVHSKHSFPAIVMYDKTGRQYAIICGPAMVYPDANRIARLITTRRAALEQQNQLLRLAEQAAPDLRPNLILDACRVAGIEMPADAQNLLKKAEPEDKSGCLAALRFHNNPLGDKIKDMTLSEILPEMDKAIANPLHTVQQKQNACAFTIGTIRRKVGSGGSDLIRKYALQMKSLDPESVLGRSADVVIRDWTHGLQFVRGWSPDSLPMQGVPTELQGKLPIGPAGKYEIRFEPTRGKNPARISRVALFDGDTFICEDARSITLTSPASYFVTAGSDLKAPRILITVDNAENERDTFGKFIINKQ